MKPILTLVFALTALTLAACASDKGGGVSQAAIEDSQGKPSTITIAAESSRPPGGEQAGGNLMLCDTVAGFACPDGQYCKFDAGTCGIEKRTGTCVAKPQMCTRDYRPQCGCDGQTYGNACDAASKGKNIDHEGECAPAEGAAVPPK